MHGRLIINETPTFGSCSVTCQGLPPPCSLWTLTGSPLGGRTDGEGRNGCSVHIFPGPEGGCFTGLLCLLVQGSILSLGIPDHVMGKPSANVQRHWQRAQVHTVVVGASAPSTRHGPPPSLPSLSPAPGLAHHRTSKCVMHEGKSVFPTSCVRVHRVCVCVNISQA